MAKRRGRPRKVTDGVVENIELEELENVKKIDEVTEEVVNELESNVEPTFEGAGTQGNYNPLMESVIERDYSTPQVAQTEVADIEEPSFVPPSYEEIVANRQDEQVQSEPNPFDNPNPAFNELDDRDKKIATESLVDTCLDAYEQLHRYAEYVVKVDEEELMQKQLEGKIDLEMQVPVSENGDTMSLGEFVQQYNEQGSNAIKYDKEFGIKVRPAMIRVFMKKGWGMSDEQFLLYMFSKDIAVKVGIMYSLKKTINSTLSMMEKVHKRNTGGARPTPKPTPVRENMTSNDSVEEDILDIPDEQVEEYLPQDETFTTNLDINMPQNPADPLKEHPKEIKKELKKEKGK